MSDKDGHLRKAEHNLKFVKTFNLENTKYLDWAAVAIFYTACHYVDAYFATTGKLEFVNHGQRNDAVEDELSPIARQYLILFRAGHDARYKPYRVFSTRDLMDYEAVHLAQIDNYILDLLNKLSS